MDRQMGRHTDVCIDVHIDVHTDAHMDIWMDRETNKWTDRQKFHPVFYMTLSPIESAAQNDTNLANFSF